MPANHLSDLARIIEVLDAEGRLIRVHSEVDPVHDLAAIAAAHEGGPRAVLFEKVKGHAVPVFTGLYWSRALLAALMRREERTLPQYVAGCIARWQKRPRAPVLVDDGPVLEVTESRVDLRRLPVPTHALDDGGAYFDAGVVIARDPETGVRNASIQRFMVTGRDSMTVNIDAGRHLELYLDKAAARGERLPFTINVGVGPGLHFAAATPAEAAPPETDELGIASEFHGAPLELVAGTKSPVEMVAHAMIALECEIAPGELADEGPFAEVTGYYALRALRPVVHVRAVHHRRAPVFQTIISGKEVFNSVGLLGEANVLNLLQRQVPGVRDVYFSHGGCGFYHAVVQIAQTRAGWSKQALLADFAAFPPLKMVTVVDDDVDIRDASDVEWAMATRLDPKSGIVVIDKAFGHGLNPSFPDYLGAKVGFDATRPYPHQYAHHRAALKQVSLEGVELTVPAIAEARPARTGRRRKPAPAAGGSAM
jgi:2,5-furandicarboxylate decarboxylase 1